MAVPLVPVVTTSAVGKEVVRKVTMKGTTGVSSSLLRGFFTPIHRSFWETQDCWRWRVGWNRLPRLDMLIVEDEGLRVALATFQLKGTANYWWKYVKGTVGTTWVAFIEAFLTKYFPPSARERLWEEFVELRQGATPLVQFERRFVSLSRFAPELVAIEERRCYEFERRLHDDIREKVV
ncbi:uncharacterized protein LOC114280435 [Camellia sinensis]|uniref:uncharacterized protein LOC114280435 n=1 Tax=Camellia sinensis TaxID=4442 RepID=UPI001036786C|nr:uncharacterized protein LOC114280435 [Camellia sinensis]